MMNDHAEATTSSRTINRRTMLRVGAHATWAVPAVQVIGMAPALAVSTSCQLTVSAQWANDSLTLTITNTGQQPATNLTVTTGFGIGNPKYVSHNGNGRSWTVTQGKKMFTFTDGTLKPNETAILTVKFSNVANGKNGTAAGDASGAVTGGSGCSSAYSVKTRTK